VKQFVQTLKGIAFDWYTDLLPESIDNWEQIEQEFLNRFYSTHRTVSMTELTNTKQWKDEPVLDYINCWCSLSLKCKDSLSEPSAVEMCAQGIERDLLYILQMSKLRTFQELATKAHNMEMTIANCCGKASPSFEARKQKSDLKKNTKCSKSSSKESMLVTMSKPVRISEKQRAEEKLRPSTRDAGKKRPTLKEKRSTHFLTRICQGC